MRSVKSMTEDILSHMTGWGPSSGSPAGAQAPVMQDVRPAGAPSEEAVEQDVRPEIRGIEPIDVVEDWGLGFCLGRAVECIAEAARGDADAVRRAVGYLERELARGMRDRGQGRRAGDAEERRA